MTVEGREPLWDPKNDEEFTESVPPFFSFFFFFQAHEVLQSFVQSQATTKESILQADKALTAGEKALAGTGQGSDHRWEGRFLQCLATGVRAKPS